LLKKHRLPLSSSQASISGVPAGTVKTSPFAMVHTKAQALHLSFSRQKKRKPTTFAGANKLKINRFATVHTGVCKYQIINHKFKFNKIAKGKKLKRVYMNLEKGTMGL
jgi:hypothetical protein